MRLNKYIAQSGVASRRKADELIHNGNVKVNGISVREMGVQVNDEDVVTVNGSVIRPIENKKYILLNKPLGYVTTMQDEYNRPIVTDLVTDVGERIFPVGRLDYNTSGMLIMTNDGDMAYKLTHPKHEITKTYKVRVAGYISDSKINRLRRGIDIGGFVTSQAQVRVTKQMQRSTVLEITIHEGKNRQVRKMFKAVGHPVQELERIAIGDIKLGRLKVGQYRALSKEEIEKLI